MLSVFRQMEENLSRGDAKDPIIRPLKQFTPPRDTVGSGTGRGVNNESEEDDEEEEYDEDDVVDGEEDEEDEGGQETESRQTEDEFLKEVGVSVQLPTIQVVSSRTYAYGPCKTE